jgi:hypothetical protein
VVTFFSSTVLILAVLLVASGPLFYLSWERRNTRKIRNFLIGAAGVAIVCGFLSFSSKQLIAKCHDAGNTSCFDPGSTGMQAVFVVGYLIVAWVTTGLLYRESR